jgi:hypothetical protein
VSLEQIKMCRKYLSAENYELVSGTFACVSFVDQGSNKCAKILNDLLQIFLLVNFPPIYSTPCFRAPHPGKQQFSPIPRSIIRPAFEILFKAKLDCIFGRARFWQ